MNQNITHESLLKKYKKNLEFSSVMVQKIWKGESKIVVLGKRA